MIRPISKARTSVYVNDYQVLKGACENSMEAFGSPVCTAHEACLLIQNDRQKTSTGASSLYVVHQRSENRIVRIFEPRKTVVTMMKKRESVSRFPLPQAA